MSAPVMLRTTSVEPNREQPRKFFDEQALKELADSISKLGIIQPIAVEKADGYYRIVAGERRWRAAMMLHLKEIPAVILDLSGQEAAEAAIAENIHREDLNPMEKAMAYRDYCDKYHMTHEELAKRISKSRVSVTNTMRLLSLADDVQAKIADGSISAGHGVVLASLMDEDKQREMANRIVKEGMSVRDVELAVRKKTKTAKKGMPEKHCTYDPEWIGRTLTEKTGWKVSVTDGGGKGSVRIDYFSEDMLNEIYEYLSGRSVPGVGDDAESDLEITV